jgi:hypothetical protein
VLDEQGLPADAALARVVADARSLSVPPDAPGLEKLGQSLLEAGWFREARALAAALAAHDLEGALAIEDHAAAAQQLLGDIQRLLDSAQSGLERAHGVAGSPAIGNLNALLGAMAPALARAHAVRGGECDEQRLAESLTTSPRLDYGAFASIVHPGPLFSKADAEAELGVEGAAVPGLAEMLAQLGRFGIFGEMLGGGGPDGTLLPRVRVVQRSGEHLGVPWRGTIALCEGTDVKTRAGRLGAAISGAALHEGYWVDIDSLRHERAPWESFRRRFIVEGDPARVASALDSRGLALSTPRDNVEARRRERRDASILLGEADRQRLEVLVERGAAGLSLDELLDATATHEEGHLCDRTRFLPLSQHVPRALGLLARVGFNPGRIAQRLEYRAQLVALCDTADPRIPLVAVVRGSEGGGGEITPHGAAYRDLLVDLLELLDRELERAPAEWSALDPDFVLALQLHRLSGDDVRRVARKLAEREGLFDK